MNEPLRPLSLGEVLDRTAQLYRSRFPVFFGIGVIPSGAMLAFFAAWVAFFAWIGSTATNGRPAPAALAVSVGFVGITGLIAMPTFIAATALEWAAMSYAAAVLHLGESISIGAAYQFAWRHGWRHVGLFLLIAMAIGVAPFSAFLAGGVLVSFLTLLAGNAGRNAMIALVGFLAFIFVIGVMAVTLWVLLRLALAFPACVVERINAWHAAKRAWTLSVGTKARVLVLGLLGTALSWILALGFSLPAMILITLIPGLRGPRHDQLLGMIVLFVWYGVWFAAQIFVRPIFGIGLTLFYFDQRVRKEGFDIEWMMERAGLTPAQITQPQAAPWLTAATEAAEQKAEQAEPTEVSPPSTRGPA